MIICQDSFLKEVMFGSVELIQSHHFSVHAANQVNGELCFNYSRSLDCLCFSDFLNCFGVFFSYLYSYDLLTFKGTDVQKYMFCCLFS